MIQLLLSVLKPITEIHLFLCVSGKPQDPKAADGKDRKRCLYVRCNMLDIDTFEPDSLPLTLR